MGVKPLPLSPEYKAEQAKKVAKIKKWATPMIKTLLRNRIISKKQAEAYNKELKTQAFHVSYQLKAIRTIQKTIIKLEKQKLITIDEGRKILNKIQSPERGYFGITIIEEDLRDYVEKLKKAKKSKGKK
ncbi:hypothetical protein ACFLZH_00600 [Patescibacteria group bacterium]